MNWTDVAIVACISFCALVDLLLVATKRATVSDRIRDLGAKLSFFPYAWGVIAGHFWGPARTPAFGNWPASIATLLALGVALSVFHFVVTSTIEVPRWATLVYLPFGLTAGVIFWPQGGVWL